MGYSGPAGASLSTFCEILNKLLQTDETGTQIIAKKKKLLETSRGLIDVRVCNGYSLFSCKTAPH